MSHPLKLQNIYLRQRGKEHARRHYGRLLSMSLLVYMLVLVLEELLTVLGDMLMASEIAAFAAALNQYAQSETIGTSQSVLDAFLGLFISPKFLLFNLVYIVSVALISNGMNLGHIEQQMQVGKGGRPRVRGLFSRMNQCFKALRLSLWTGLKTFLWALPGVGTMLLGIITAGMGGQEAGGLMLLGGYVLIFVLVLPAALRYSLGMYVLAENPDRGVIDCVNESKYLMQGHKWQCFKLGIPCLLTMIGLFMATILAGGMTLGVLEAVGLTINDLAIELLTDLGILVIMLFMPRLNMTYTLFYLLRSDIARNASKPHATPDAVSLPDESTPAITDEKENPDEEPLC